MNPAPLTLRRVLPSAHRLTDFRFSIDMCSAPGLAFNTGTCTESASFCAIWPDGRSGGCSPSVRVRSPAFITCQGERPSPMTDIGLMQLVRTEEVDGSQLFRATGCAQDQCGRPLDSTRSRTRSHASAGSIWGHRDPGRAIQADRYDGSPSHPAGRDSNSPPPGPNSLPKRGVN